MIRQYFYIDPKVKQEKIKERNNISIEIEGIDELPDMEKIKVLESYLNILRENGFNNIKISDEYFKDLRFTVRKTFNEKEYYDYYVDKERAKATCPPGYSVFDVLTGKCIYTHKLVKDRISEGMAYKKAWEDLKEFLNDRIKESFNYAEIYYLEAYQTVLNEIENLEGEIKNE